jgi:acetolactate synthase regulatory subunit
MRLLRADYVQLDLELHEGAVSSEALAVLERRGVRIESMRSDLHPEAERLHLELRVPPRLDFTQVLNELRAIDGVAAASAVGIRRPT